MALAVGGLLLPVGCGGNDAESNARATSTTGASAAAGGVIPRPEESPVLPVTLTGADGLSQTITDVSRIIPLNGDLAEVIFALGLGPQVVATDVSATYPPEADALPSIGYQGNLVAEQIIGHSPTVVVGHPGVGPAGVIDQLRRIGIPVVVVDQQRDLDGALDKVRATARALGVPGRGAALAEKMAAEIASARAAGENAARANGRPRVLFAYVRGENVQQVGGKGSGVDALVAGAGATDVGTEMGVDDFAPISAEAVVAARADVIVVTTNGMASVGGIDGILRLPGVAATPSGRDRRVLAYEDQMLLGLGPRTGAVLAALVRDLHGTGPK